MDRDDWSLTIEFLPMSIASGMHAALEIILCFEWFVFSLVVTDRNHQTFVAAFQIEVSWFCSLCLFTSTLREMM